MDLLTSIIGIKIEKILSWFLVYLQMEVVSMDGIYIGWMEMDSQHSIVRAKERAGLNEKRARKMIDLARNRGIRSEDCRWMVDKNFLESKCTEEAEAVAYNGFCFILERQTKQCITVFLLPKYFGKKKTYYKASDCREKQEVINQYSY